MKTLHLNLKKIWFDMILSSEKKEEYREITTYWINRLFNWRNESNWDINDFLREFEYHQNELCFIEKHSKQFETITFSNGMTPPVPRFVIELKDFEIREGKQEWGAEPGIKYFVLELGKILSSNF